MIEAFLRYHFGDEDQARRDALARRAVRFLLVATTVSSAALAAAATPLSRLVLGYPDPAIFLIAVLGLWAFTNLELAYGLLRVEERLRAYATASLANVLLTVVASVVLVVGLHKGAQGLLLGNYGVSTLVLVVLWWTMRHRLIARRGRPERMAVLLRFGLPTVPAEASVYALSIVDRYYIYHHRSPAMAGLYSIAVKLAGAVAFIVRAFQYAWPPLAYSVSDDREAARLYGLVTTYYLAGQRLGRSGPRAARTLGAAPARGAFVLRRLSRAAVGGAGLGAVRAVGHVPRDRRARQGDDAQLPGGAGRPGGEHRADRAAGADAWHRRRGDRAVRRLCGDADGHAPAHPPRVRSRVRVGTAGPFDGGDGRSCRRRRSAVADQRCAGLGDPHDRVDVDPRRAADHRLRPPRRSCRSSGRWHGAPGAFRRRRQAGS